MGIEERVVDLEKAFVQLTQLAISASERADTHEKWINSLGSNMERLSARMEELAAAQANSEVKIAALTDAQIRTEDAIAKSNDAIAKSNDAIAKSSAKSNDAIARTNDAIAKTNEALASLTSRVDHL